MLRKVSLTFIMMLFVFSVSLQADVIRMKDGQIYIGKILSIDEKGVEIDASGEKIRVQSGEILKTETDFNSLKGMAIGITLKDNSVINGKYQNYDSDIGFLVEIEFGIITVPLANIKRIEDPVQKEKSVLNVGQIGLAAGGYFMVGELASAYSSNIKVALFAEFSFDFILPGLYVGAAFAFHNMNCTVSTDAAYLLFDLQARIIYRFIAMRSLDSFLKNIVPFIGIGTGAALPVKTASGLTSMEVDLLLSGLFGFDIFLNDNIIVRVNAEWLSIPQSSLWFHSIAVNAGIAYAF